ncbi:MAG: cation:proton antiporter [Betaproteobacteria bacterium]
MDHNISVITTIAAAFMAALGLGFLAEKIKVPALVGYLVAGIVIGPGTPGYIADTEIASQLSEIGIMLLMFGVGLHFSPSELFSVKRVAVPGALIQMGVTTSVGAGIAWLWGWGIASSLIFGLCLACASTVVLLKSLEVRGELDTMGGRIAVGWLVVQDLVTVLALVLLPPFAEIIGGSKTEANVASAAPVSLWWTVGSTLLLVGAFVALMFIVGKRVLPWLLWQVAKTGSRELFTLAVVTTAIGIALGAAAFFNVSFALGAFVAGTVMRESEFSHRAAQETLPLRDAFSVLFFVSIGMMVDPAVFLDQPWRILVVVLVVMFVNFASAVVIVIANRYPLSTALSIGASLGQIGEFSIILGGLALGLGVIKSEVMNLILAGVLLSITLNTLLFKAVEPLRRWVLSRSAVARRLDQRQDPTAALPMSTDRKYLEGQLVLVGYGRVGKRIGFALTERGIPYVIVEQSRERVEELREQGFAAVAGNPGDPEVLIQAHIAKAAMLVIATPDTVHVRQMVETARLLNPAIEVVVRTHSEDESELLAADGLGKIFFGEDELAKGMVRHIYDRFAPKAH